MLDSATNTLPTLEIFASNSIQKSYLARQMGQNRHGVARYQNSLQIVVGRGGGDTIGPEWPGVGVAPSLPAEDHISLHSTVSLAADFSGSDYQPTDDSHTTRTHSIVLRHHSGTQLSVFAALSMEGRAGAGHIALPAVDSAGFYY